MAREVFRPRVILFFSCCGDGSPCLANPHPSISEDYQRMNFTPNVHKFTTFPCCKRHFLVGVAGVTCWLHRSDDFKKIPWINLQENVDQNTFFLSTKSPKRENHSTLSVSEKLKSCSLHLVSNFLRNALESKLFEGQQQSPRTNFFVSSFFVSSHAALFWT